MILCKFYQAKIVYNKFILDWIVCWIRVTFNFKIWMKFDVKFDTLRLVVKLCNSKLNESFS